MIQLVSEPRLMMVAVAFTLVRISNVVTIMKRRRCVNQNIAHPFQLVLWDNNGIRVWLFHRGSIPADLDRDEPLPETWGQPMATIPASGCNPYEYMRDHIAILDTTLWYVI